MLFRATDSYDRRRAQLQISLDVLRVVCPSNMTKMVVVEGLEDERPGLPADDRC
jgi:hypothetical protein